MMLFSGSVTNPRFRVHFGLGAQPHISALPRVHSSSNRGPNAAHSSRSDSNDSSALTAGRLVAGIGRLIEPLVTTLQGEATRSRGAQGGSVSPAGPRSAIDDPRHSATYQLLALNALVFLLVNCWGVLPAAVLQLDHSAPLLGRCWWQLLTSGFLHRGVEHLAQTTFFGYIFGRLVERRDGPLGVWLTYVACVIGANLLALRLLPHYAGRVAVTSVSSSAAVFGLFVVGALLPRLTARLPELLCLTPFICIATASRYSALAGAFVVDGIKVGHLIHMVGAFAAACVVAVALNVVAAAAARAAAEAAALERVAREAAAYDRDRRAAAGLDSMYDATTRAVADLAKRML